MTVDRPLPGESGYVENAESTEQMTDDLGNDKREDGSKGRMDRPSQPRPISQPENQRPSGPAATQSLEDILDRVKNLVDDAGEPTGDRPVNMPRPTPPSPTPTARPRAGAASPAQQPRPNQPQQTRPGQPQPASNVAAEQAKRAAAAKEAEKRRVLASLLGEPDVAKGEFFPREPRSLAEAKVNEGEVEGLALRSLLAQAEARGRQLATDICLSFNLVESVLSKLKNDQLIAFKSSAPMNDYVYALTDRGRERARRHNETTTYIGAAPVALSDYIKAIEAQSITKQKPTLADVKQAFSDLLINENMLYKLGPAMNSGRGMFLFGGPGNGKTSIAERITAAFGETIWIPRAIGVEGSILRLFDPMNHEEMPPETGSALLNQMKWDERWVRIRRPTIIVGGELTMDALEVSTNPESKISEAPVQLKSNCGTLVIDDFGRQRMTTDELLNRWIVPLEKRYDFLNMPGGKKIKVPFDQLIVFSTNLEPKDLVDGAFLRRIPYKIEVTDPSEEEFRALLKIMAPKMGVEYDQEVADYLVEHHYKQVNRPFACCQPRDLMDQVRNFCQFREKEQKMTRETVDFAVENYFSVM